MIPQLTYQPIQPFGRPNSLGITYQELAPDRRLSSLIRCYWELKTTQALETPFLYNVVADGCIDVFFEMGSLSSGQVAGFNPQYVEFSLGQQFHYFGVRFLPTAFPQIFKVNASELTGRVEALDGVVPEMSRYLTWVVALPATLPTIKAYFDHFLLSKLCKIQFDNDGRLYECMDQIIRYSGAINVESDIKTGISPRQLRRLFEFYIGDSPKMFSQVVRFQHVLQTNGRSKDSLSFYHDQSHFVKSFKRFSGTTPGNMFRK